MPLNSNDLKFIIGSEETIQNMVNAPALELFDDAIISYLDHVSKLLLKNPEAKKYPDVVTFAFWCRKASTYYLKKPYENKLNRIGRGIAFHIAPSNVPVNFAYSLVTGLLSGNGNIVRIPSKDFDQVRLLCDALSNALNDDVKQYICLIQYGHNEDITQYFSSICDTRIIWGGDQTIMTIRKAPLKARATEITFADRNSICLINAEEYLKSENTKSIAQGFYNDTYLTDQNACTSPRIVIWMGNKVKEAQDIFWSELHNIVKTNYTLQPVQAVGKLANLYRQAVSDGQFQLNKCIDNYIVRVNVNSINETTLDYKGNCGYFMEYEAGSLNDILPLCTSQLQTLSYYGIDCCELREFVTKTRPRGIDRIVPVGKTMEFAFIWDGFDLIYSLSREISFY